MVTATSTKLLGFNAWGLVSVEGQYVTVILSAITLAGHPLKRTLKREVERKLGFTGSALVAATIRPVGYDLHVNEIGVTQVASHPEVTAIITDAVDWIRQSIG